MNNLSENKKSLIKLIISVAVIAVLILVGYFIFKAFGITDVSKEQIQDFVASTGAIAPIVFVLISFLQVTFVPIPGMITIIAGSYLFGAWQSFLYSYIGMMIGAIVGFYLGRLIGRPFINWIAGGKEKADEWLKKLKGRETVFLFFAFLLPLFPDDLLCSVAGMISMRFSTFFVMQIITRATSIGASLFFMSGEIIPFHGWGLWVLGAIGVVCLVAFILSMKYADKLNSFFDKFISKFVRK